MERDRARLNGFARYAWFALGYNLLVILWGVFLRASKSGDGCGQHWLTCHGEVVPSAPELKTVIEFSHRMMSALDGLVMLVLLVWAVAIWRRTRTAQSRTVMRLAIGSFIFIITEALVGAGLVLTGNTAETLTPTRPFWMAGHLINTFILLAFLSLTAWAASGEGRAPMRFVYERRIVIAAAIGLALILLVGVTGSVAALSSMIFPSESLSEGLAKDFSATSNMLLRIRPFHPIVSIAAVMYLVFFSGWLRKWSDQNGGVVRWSNVLSLLALVQLVFGGATLLMLSPIVMQLGHLLLADLIWISFVLLTVSYLNAGSRVAVDAPRATAAV
ncbi:MAG: COX15/CtaA family protein [Pyrinomonadaceae bacterium]